MNIRQRLAALLAAITVTFAAWSATPRYVFYFIGDGMGMGHVMTTQAYMRATRPDSPRLLMLQFPVASAITTYSASSPVTDSAAAGTALATGHKTNNGMLGVTPDSLAVQSIAADLYRKGWGIGIVTSVAPDDATPGAFYAHVPSRKMFYEIGRQAAFSGYDFIAGSNLRGTKNADGKPNDLLPLLASKKVTVARGLDRLAEARTRRVMLLNTDSVNVSNIGYTIDSIPGVLTLPAMTRACLDHLMAQSPAQFFMMVEGGNIDHAAHSNDGGAVVKEIINFNEAIGVAYDFYLKHPDETLIVVTADHDTGGMSLGNSYRKYAADLAVIDAQRVSKDRFNDWCRAMSSSRRSFEWPDMKEYLEKNLGFGSAVALSAEQWQSLHDKFDATFVSRTATDQATLYNSFNAFAVDVYKLLNDAAGIGFTTTSHAGNFVPLYAVGVDAARFNGIHDNTEVSRIILDIVGAAK